MSSPVKRSFSGVKRPHPSKPVAINEQGKKILIGDTVTARRKPPSPHLTFGSQLLRFTFYCSIFDLSVQRGTIAQLKFCIRGVFSQHAALTVVGPPFGRHSEGGDAVNENAHLGGGPAPGNPLSPLDILNAARKAVPAVDYALGVAGIAAAGAIVIGFLGNGRAAIIIASAIFVAMVLLFAFARLVAANNGTIIIAGIAMLWMVILFFGTFLVFTITAVAFHQPEAWARILGLETDGALDKTAVEKMLEVPKEISGRLSGIPVELLRLQPRLSDPVVFTKREAALLGGGAYYSFVRRSHEYSEDSNIELLPGQFTTGFAGANYGFFMYTGQGTPAELVTFKRDTPPSHLEPGRIDAWKYMWDYKPPTEIKSIRAEQRKFRGVTVAGVNLSNEAAVIKPGVYLLRSVLIQRSDVLIALGVVETLTDGSVILAWRTLSVFDTPIAVGEE